MSKVFKDEIIFNNFKNNFNEIFKDKNFIDMTKNHFNKNGSFAVFTLALLQNRVSEGKIIANARINKQDWMIMFENLYKDQNIINTFEKLNLNPVITLNNIVKMFVVFENFANQVWSYVAEQNWDLNISKNDFIEMISSAFGYLTYNQIECKLNNKLSDIVQDPQYDTKYTIILNNTKLFAKAKSCILKHCELKINDLIVILLGASNHLALDK